MCLCVEAACSCVSVCAEGALKVCVRVCLCVCLVEIHVGAVSSQTKLDSVNQGLVPTRPM